MLIVKNSDNFNCNFNVTLKKKHQVEIESRTFYFGKKHYPINYKYVAIEI